MILDLILVLLASIFIYKGIKKGFLITLSEFLAWVVSSFISIILSRLFATFLYDNFISKEIQNKINDLLVSTESINLIDKVKVFIEEIPDYILNICHISNLSKDNLIYIINNQMEPGKLLAENIRPVFINVLSVLISIVFIFIFMVLITTLMKKVTRSLPSGLSVVNRLMGAFIGTLKFILILFISFLFVKSLMLVISEESKDYILSAINNTYLLKQLYSINFLNLM